MASPTAGLRDVIAASSGICNVDGVQGKLSYRGYDIADLARHSTFEEVIYLLWHGELPTHLQLEQLAEVIKSEAELPAEVLDMLGSLPSSGAPMSALRTAVMVAQALGNQKLVLDQITALNTTTSSMIERTSEMLRDNSVAVQQQAASATIGLPQLQAAFQNIYATMDAIDSFKVQALDNMSATICTLETEVSKSREYLDRVERQNPQVTRGALDLGNTVGTGR